jgi:hypothetical protein
MTSITITDPALIAQFAAAPGVVTVCDPDGRVIGTFILEGYGKPPPGVKSPISDEEFEEARKQTGGLPLSEVWRRIHERYGE